MTLKSASDTPPPAVGNVDNVRADASDRRTKATTDLVFRKDDTLIVRGWIAASHLAATVAQRVRVCVDDVFDAQVAAHVSRRDVAQYLGAPNLEHSGFVAVLSAARLATGPHTISVAVYEAPGAEPRPMPTVYPFTIVDDLGLIPDLHVAAPDRIGGAIETWTALPRHGPGGARELDVFVRGWACDFETASPVSDVFGIVDHRYTGRALMGYPRPDVAERLGSAAYEACGFRFRMILPAAVANGGSIEIVAVSGDCTQRRPIVSARSTPRLPVFRDGSHAGTDEAFADTETYERLVLSDVVELDRLRDERIEKTLP